MGWLINRKHRVNIGPRGNPSPISLHPRIYLSVRVANSIDCICPQDWSMPGSRRDDTETASERSSGLARRAFLKSAGKKACWVAPTVWTISARQTLAAGSHPSANPSCMAFNEDCVTNADCCSNNCFAGKCAGS